MIIKFKMFCLTQWCSAFWPCRLAEWHGTSPKARSLVKLACGVEPCTGLFGPHLCPALCIHIGPCTHSAQLYMPKFVRKLPKPRVSRVQGYALQPARLPTGPEIWLQGIGNYHYHCSPTTTFSDSRRSQKVIGKTP